MEKEREGGLCLKSGRGRQDMGRRKEKGKKRWNEKGRGDAVLGGYVRSKEQKTIEQGINPKSDS